MVEQGHVFVYACMMDEEGGLLDEEDSWKERLLIYINLPAACYTEYIP